MRARLSKIWTAATMPATILFLLSSPRIHPGYRLTWPKRLRLGWRMWRTTRAVWTGTSYKAHLAMAAKLLEIPPDVEGVVVECGSYLGGSTANLSLACELAGRELIVYDSFQGLPAPRGNDRYAHQSRTGFLDAPLDQVKENVRRFGRIERCTFRVGWFAETLPDHTEPVVLAFLDVDYQASLDDCITHLWPHLIEKGYVFTDEYIFTEFCALFWSERYWKQRFDTQPPGLIGSGSGVGVGQYYLGPANEWDTGQDPASVAYTRKDFCGRWDYDAAAAPLEEDREHAGGPF
jgi:O-methyltransferase